MNIWRGRRQSASATYLRPALERPNLTLMVETLVAKVVIDESVIRGDSEPLLVYQNSEPARVAAPEE